MSHYCSSGAETANRNREPRNEPLKGGHYASEADLQQLNVVCLRRFDDDSADEVVRGKHGAQFLLDALRLLAPHAQVLTSVETSCRRHSGSKALLTRWKRTPRHLLCKSGGGGLRGLFWICKPLPGNADGVRMFGNLDQAQV